MRTLAESQRSWALLESFDTLSELRAEVQKSNDSVGTSPGSRSVCWKVFLLFDTLDRPTWSRRIKDSRSAYDSLRTHFLRNLEHPEEITSGLDPLSEDVESPWVTLRQDETLRAEIHQDVERCMPENDYFREPATQMTLLDILFIFCKLNPDVGYRQGMHELLAPILWVVEQDALAPESLRERPSGSDLLCQICDAKYTEHDAFTLFSIIMQNAKSFYEQAAHGTPSALIKKTEGAAAPLENPMVTRVRRIFEDYLPQVDPNLATHLKEIDLIPQVFLMRWIRLLFGREFEFEDVLSIWDIIFAEDPSLEIVDVICVTMLLRLHWDLLDADYNTALTLLLRYPAFSSPQQPQMLAVDALYLRANFNTEGASYLIKRYTGKSPVLDKSPPSDASLVPQTRSLPQSFVDRLQAPPRLARQSSNIEGILQDAARGMYSRGEKWGINKAVRDAMQEVRKGVREIQSVQTPQAPRRHLRVGSRNSVTSSDSKGMEMAAKLAGLEQRNAALAKMLEGAVSELWEHQNRVAKDKDPEDEGLKALNVAIAKVQFAQVYLADPTIPLPAEERTGNTEAEVESSQEKTSDGSQQNEVLFEQHEEQTPDARDAATAAQEAAELPAPSAPPKATNTKKPNTHTEHQPVIPTKTPETQSATPKPNEDKPSISAPRPSLAQSSFSWMLGQDQRPVSFIRAGPPPAEKRRNKGFLFGDEDEDPSQAKSSTAPGRKRGDSKAKGKGKMKRAVEALEDPESFDLSTLETEEEGKV